MVLAIGHLTLDTEIPHHKILQEHILNILINLPDRIDIFFHAANFARIPLTKDGDSFVPYFFASSTASLTDTL